MILQNDYSNMRILVVTRGLPFHSLGGMEAVAWDLSREFSRLGSDVTILTTHSPQLPAHSDVEGVHIHCLNAPTGRYSRAWWHLSQQAYKNHYAQKIDVVLSVSAGAMAMVKLRSESKPIFVVQAHGTSWGEFISKWKQGTFLAALKSIRNIKGMLDDFGFRRFDAFVAVGRAVEYDLLRAPTRWIVGDMPVQVIPNGVDVDVFSYDEAERHRVRALLGIDSSHKVILSACRLHPQKGVMEALEAFAQAIQQDVNLRFIIAGNGPDEARLKQRSKDLNIAHAVHFVGAIKREQMKAYFSAADIFLFATKRVEGLPMNVLEALASGLPVIISKHINDERFGATVINPDDIQSINQAILTVKKSENRSSSLPEIFTLKFAARQYLDLFQKINNR
jgi:glycosyltransferase involved in cell wall biosynthesis